MNILDKQSATKILITAIALSFAAPGAFAKELSEVNSTFDRSGSDNNAKASINSSFGNNVSKMKIKCKGLDDNQNYRLFVDGVKQSKFKSRSGKAKLKFSTNPVGPEKPLDFDPRASVLNIKDRNSSILKTVFNSSGDPATARIKEITALAPTALAPGGKGEARYTRIDGRSTFKVEIEDVPMGDYELFVNSTPRGTIMVGSTGEGKIKFDTRPSTLKLPLDFDPRNLPVDVLRNGEAYFSGVMSAQINQVNQCAFSKRVQMLASTGADADAHADAEFKTREDCRLDFNVEAEDLPVGSYKVFVNDVFRGKLNVIATTGGTHGELEFSSDPDEDGKLLLNFDPQDKVVKIKQDSTVYFSDKINNDVPVPPTFEVINVEPALINSGIVSSARGKARFRQDDDGSQDFRVEIDDLPIASYQLFVGGVNRGDIGVVLVNGENTGQIEFDTSPKPDEVLLNFDPRGQIIEVRQGADVLLSRDFPD